MKKKVVVDTFQNSFSGREIVLIQKRLFGGIALSKEFYDWATIPGSALEDILKTDSDFTERRQTKT
eukprot:UN18388